MIRCSWRSLLFPNTDVELAHESEIIRLVVLLLLLSGINSWSVEKWRMPSGNANRRTEDLPRESDWRLLLPLHENEQRVYCDCCQLQCQCKLAFKFVDEVSLLCLQFLIYLNKVSSSWHRAGCIIKIQHWILEGLPLFVGVSYIPETFIVLLVMQLTAVIYFIFLILEFKCILVLLDASLLLWFKLTVSYCEMLWWGSAHLRAAR